MSKTEKDIEKKDSNSEASPVEGVSQKTSKKNKLKSLVRSKKMMVLATFIFLVLFGLAGYGFYLNSHFAPGTRLGAQDVSLKTHEQVKALIEERADSYTITIKDYEKQPSLAELGVAVDIDQTYQNMVNAQGSWAQKLNVFAKKENNFALSIDQEKLEKYLQEHKQNNDKEALDAQIIIEGGEVEIVPEVNSTVTEIRDANIKIVDSARNLDPLVLEPEVFEKPPKITAKDLEDNMGKVKSMLNTSINLSMKGNNLAVSRSQIGSWISIEGHEISLNRSRIEAYIDSAVEPYINVPKATIVSKNSDGSSRVLSKGVDGSDVSGKSALIDEIQGSLQAQKSLNRKVEFSFAKSPVIEAGEWDKWLEVDLTNKRMYAYEKSRLVKSFLVSAGAADTPTVVGTYQIRAKVRSQTMRGYNADGSRYEQPNVEWVNYFFEDYAIHGNYWRPASVFGNVNTSHGCVGITNSEAKWVYDWAPVGTTIVTHY